MAHPAVVRLRTSDGVDLVADHFPADDRRTGLVLAHGFTGHAGNTDVRRIAVALHEQGFGVLVPDLRGHGRSAGFTTAGADEIHDVAAAAAWLRGAGYVRVGLVGFSMGGSAVLRYAGLGGDADAVVSVSAPGTWFERGTRPMRIVHWMFEKRTGRATVRLLRKTRVSPQAWQTTPEAPVDVVAAIAPRPLLLVHGEADHYFPGHHVEALSAAASEATVWVEPAMAHAEQATTPDLVRRIGAWLHDALAAAATARVCDDDGRD